MQSIIRYFKTFNIETNYLIQLEQHKINIIINSIKNNKIILTNDPEILFYYGMYFQSIENYAQMINFYNMAIENRNYLSYIALGYYYEKIDSEKSIFYFEKALNKGFTSSILNLIELNISLTGQIGSTLDTLVENTTLFISIPAPTLVLIPLILKKFREQEDITEEITIMKRYTRESSLVQMKLMEIYIRGERASDMEILVEEVRQTDFLNKAEILYLFGEFKYRKFLEGNRKLTPAEIGIVMQFLVEAAEIGSIEAMYLIGNIFMEYNMEEEGRLLIIKAREKDLLFH